jgi:glyoxylase-like metal-dependent hydrolase (beta-lactamase superfamily II)
MFGLSFLPAPLIHTLAATPLYYLMKVPFIALALLSAGGGLFAQNGALDSCWSRLVKPLEQRYAAFTFTESLNELHHSPEPWQQTPYKGKGAGWLTVNSMHKSDTLLGPNGRTLTSRRTVSDSTLLFFDYGSKEIAQVTIGMRFEHFINTARYSPVLLLQHFHKRKIAPAGSDSLWEYTDQLHRTIVKLFIRKTGNTVAKIVTLQPDPLHGDLENTYEYSDYTTAQGITFPTHVKIGKIGGRVRDEVHLGITGVVNAPTLVLEKPSDYTVYDDFIFRDEVKHWKYNPRIHFLDVVDVEEQVMVAEFADFLFVAEAPLSSENGELIIREAKKIAPGKPIRYFSFGHHHPHYTGGLRAFVHEGATILCHRSDSAYVTYLATAPHTLKPDRLQREPWPLKMEFIDKMKSVGDGKSVMQIQFIGERSAHTKDYLVYYFPAEKLVFEGDLAWIPKEGAIPRASKSQAGLYFALKEAGLTVDTLVQAWRTGASRYKTTFTFAELEESVYKEP